jgi:hypothetical protein
MTAPKPAKIQYAKSAVARIRIPLEERNHAFQLIKYEDHSFDTYKAFAEKYHDLKAKGVEFEVDEVCCHTCIRMNGYGIQKLLSRAK